MATKDQFEFFNERYTEEIGRSKELLDKSKIYFSVVTIITSILFTNLTSFQELIGKVPETKNALVAILGISFIIIFILFISIRVKNYYLPINTDNYLDSLPDDPESDEDFFDNRIAEIIVAIDENQRINNSKACWLKYAEYGILTLTLIIVVTTFLIIYK